jgi:uncharacterized protein YfiM (DUF2279 family)
MKKILIITLLVLLPIPSHALEPDKNKHLIASALIFGTAYAVTEDIKTSVLIALGVGVSKELYDSAHKNGDGFDTHDLAAGAVGIGLGVLWVQHF